MIFDVEHGACALLTCDNGERLMIDCGHNASTGWRPGDYLQRLGVSALKMLVITNYDEDHVSGLPNLTSKVVVQSFLGNPSVSAQTLLALKSECGHGPGVAKLTQMMTSAGVWSGPPQFPGATWNAYWNKYPAFDDENNLSLAFQLVVNGFGFLFPGDLESAGWKQLLGANPLGFTNAVKATNFLIASHHGRISGVCTELFDDYGCSPQLVVISDDCHQYDTQKTTTYYASKCSGIQNFRIAGTTRFVLTTRSDGPINFSFPSAGGCVVT